MTKSRCSPTVPRSAMPSAASRARSTALRRVASSLGGMRSAHRAVELVGHAAQHLGDLGRLGLVRVAPATEGVRGGVEQLDGVLADDSHLVGREALLLV